MRPFVNTRVILAPSFCALLLVAACEQKPIAGPLVLIPNAAVPHQIGHFDAANLTLSANAGERGMLAYGPYAELAPGHYEAAIVVSSGHGAGPVGTVDVNAFTAERPGNVLASLSIPADADDVSLKMQFDVPAGVKLEFRVFSEGTTMVSLHRTQIRKL